MILAGPDTIFGNLNLADHLGQLRDVIGALHTLRQQDVQEDAEVNVRGQPIHYYPERSAGNWLAFRTWIDTGNRQAVPLEWRVYAKNVNTRSNHWPIELVFRSVPLWTLPFTQLWSEAMKVLRKLVRNPEALYSEDGKCAVPSRVSRIDWAVDTDELQLTPGDAPRFLSRARYRAMYLSDQQLIEHDDVDVSIHHIGAEFTGLAFGRGAIHARVYNKWLEIAKARSYKRGDKRFFADLWAVHGWARDRPVWRLEIQIRREALHQIRDDAGVPLAHHSIPDTVAAFPNTLPYWFGEWLTLRQPNEDPNRSRWPVDPVWQRVVETASRMDEHFVRVPRQIAFDEFALAQSITGLLSSYSLAVGIASPQVLMPILAKTLARSLGISTNEWFWRVQSDQQRKAAKYGMKKEELHYANQSHA